MINAIRKLQIGLSGWFLLGKVLEKTTEVASILDREDGKDLDSGSDSVPSLSGSSMPSRSLLP